MFLEEGFDQYIMYREILSARMSSTNVPGSQIRVTSCGDDDTWKCVKVAFFYQSLKYGVLDKNVMKVENSLSTVHYVTWIWSTRPRICLKSRNQVLNK